MQKTNTFMMKKILIMAMAATLLASCGGNGTQGNGNDSTAVAMDGEQMTDGQEYEENGVVKTYFVTSVQQVDSQTTISINMMPDESLPKIKNENLGKIYCDNKAVVTFKQGGQVLLERTFNKMSFESYVDARLLQNATLFRLQYAGRQGNGVKLLAIISVPHSEEEADIYVTLTPDGGMSMEKDQADAVPEDLDAEIGD